MLKGIKQALKRKMKLTGIGVQCLGATTTEEKSSKDLLITYNVLKLDENISFTYAMNVVTHSLCFYEDQQQNIILDINLSWHYLSRV